MPVTITIRSVPDDVRNALAARAKRRGKSLQEYLQGELRRVAETPTMDEWLAEAREARSKYQDTSMSAVPMSTDEILDAIHGARGERTGHLIDVIEGRVDGGGGDDGGGGGDRGEGGVRGGRGDRAVPDDGSEHRPT